MKIAIQAADLDSSRIDGTRIYIFNLLRRFGLIAPADDFFIYHRRKFNPELTPPEYSNYQIKAMDLPFFWTQLRFGLEMRRLNPEALWMPFHNVPLIRNKKTKTTVTIHDLAFKYFPEYFPKWDLLKLNWLIDTAILKSDKITAISEATKKDILHFYPQVSEDKIRVIYHGFDSELFEERVLEGETTKVLERYSLQKEKYLLYVGALQPRKNLITLIEAFDLVKKEIPDLKLVLAGGKAWMWEGIFERLNASQFKKDIVTTGQVGGKDLAALYQNASAFVFPSFYEGFGIPVLEAFAAGTPVIAARNSSLPEVGGEAAVYFDATNQKELAEKIISVVADPAKRQSLIEMGRERSKNFSWDKCAQETLEWIKY
jgi:glycosyltransferase involved in cell wall biosynthesis